MAKMRKHPLWFAYGKEPLRKTKIEKNNLCGRSLVRIRARIERKYFVVGLWFGLGKHIEKYQLM